ncbi:MAG: DUF933 domain-containing protein [Candidatus Zixiibacteriota bacterium]
MPKALPLSSRLHTIGDVKLGIIGKPQSGKTTIFNAASGQHASVGDFSQTVHKAVVKVPDQRLDVLAEIEKTQKITPAEVEFLDAPGLSGKGKEGASAEINPDLKLMDALILVVDAFSDTATPEADIQSLIEEMVFVDQIVVESNIEKKLRKAKVTGDKSDQHELDLLHRCLKSLESGKPVIDLDLREDELRLLKGYAFISQKPLLIVVNIGENDLPNVAALSGKYASLVSSGKREVAIVCGKIEMELTALAGDEKAMFMKELGIETAAMNQVIQKAYSLLGLISFLTAGEKEVRAWPIKAGTNAQRAAGTIHSDIERGFIRAEVTRYDDYCTYKTAAALKAAGKTRLEGKEYLMHDGDVVLFRFNV